MSVVIRLKVPIEMHYTVIPMGTSKVNSFLKLILRKFKKIKKDKKYKKKQNLTITRRLASVARRVDDSDTE